MSGRRVRLSRLAASSSGRRSRSRGKYASNADEPFSGKSTGTQTHVRTLAGDTYAWDLRQMPTDDYALLRTRTVGKKAGSTPVIAFLNKCRPVFCIRTTGTLACYFDGDTMPPSLLWETAYRETTHTPICGSRRSSMHASVQWPVYWRQKQKITKP
jgi:hypothetical protein